MAPEIFWLTLTAAFTVVLWLPYGYYRVSRMIPKIGFLRLAADPLPGDDPFDDDWPHRAYRSHMNAVENLVVFAPLVLAVIVTGAGNEVTAAASATYFFARLAHAMFYTIKLPHVRTIAWMTGVIACLVIAYQIVV
ncbi:MAG: MAPEG family protein [Alphaproteobacteria bacterium]